jgi:hypothetical protein
VKFGSLMVRDGQRFLNSSRPQCARRLGREEAAERTGVVGELHLLASDAT